MLWNPSRGSDFGSPGYISDFASTSYWSGDTGNYGIVTYGTLSDDAFQGGATAASITSRTGDGLPHYPTEGDKHRVGLYVSSSGDVASAGFCIQSEATPGGAESGYYVSIDPDNSQAWLREYDGSFSTITTCGSSVSTGTWYIVEATHYTDHNFDLRLLDSSASELASSYGEATLSYSSGGVKCRHIGSNGSQYWDEWKHLGEGY
jgi:hypothetical protein